MGSKVVGKYQSELEQSRKVTEIFMQISNSRVGVCMNIDAYFWITWRLKHHNYVDRYLNKQLVRWIYVLPSFSFEQESK